MAASPLCSLGVSPSIVENLEFFHQLYPYLVFITNKDLVFITNKNLVFITNKYEVAVSPLKNHSFKNLTIV